MQSPEYDKPAADNDPQAQEREKQAESIGRNAFWISVTVALVVWYFKSAWTGLKYGTLLYLTYVCFHIIRSILWARANKKKG